jgi:hypothetical protein
LMMVSMAMPIRTSTTQNNATDWRVSFMHVPGGEQVLAGRADAGRPAPG